MASNEIYWPPGWFRDRLVHASADELSTLRPEDSDRMFDSLRAALGTDGFGHLVKEMSDNYQARVDEEARGRGESANWLDQLEPEDRVPLLKTLRERCAEGPFGWVVYRTCCYDDEPAWREFQDKFDRFISSDFEPNIDVPGVKEAKARFEIRWIEEASLADAGVAEVAKRYRALMPTLPEGLQHPMCLLVGSTELRSVVDSPMPTPSPIHEQLMIPYVLAVDATAGEDVQQDTWNAEEHGWRTSFKVALHALTGDLLRMILHDSRSPGELSVGVSEDKIWWSGAGRYGIFTIGVSQTD